MLNNNSNDAMYYRQVIIDHYSSPNHKGLRDDDQLLHIHQKSSTCIDNINLQLKIKDNAIVEGYFDGEGCAISTASTDIMFDEIVGKNRDEAKEIIQNYINMLYEKKYDEKRLGDLIVFSNVYKQPNRIKCALIGVEGMLKLIDNKGSEE